MTWYIFVSTASGLASAAIAGGLIVPVLAGLPGLNDRRRRRTRQQAAILDRLREGADFPAGTPPAPAQIAVGAAINDALALLGPSAASLEVVIDLDVEPRLTAYADPRALRRLLVNLIAPAISANPDSHLLLVAGRRADCVRIVLAADDVADRAARSLAETARIRAALGASLRSEILQGAGTTTILTLPAHAPVEGEATATDTPTDWNRTLDRSMAAFRAVLSTPQESATKLHMKANRPFASSKASPEGHTFA